MIVNTAEFRNVTGQVNLAIGAITMCKSTRDSMVQVQDAGERHELDL